MPESQRAILSVYDKSGLLELGRGLVTLGFELIASGGTARVLREAGMPVIRVGDWTGFPEMLEGRVKTLHPAIHAGILAMDTPAHLSELERQGLKPIDLVVCNLYPFQRTVADPGVAVADAVEQIDIGGVTLIRAAAKNHARVTVVVDPADYDGLLSELGQGGVSEATRKRLAYKAFAHTAAYDESIRSYFQARGYAGASDLFPERATIHLERGQSLRYGENPHQQAALYRIPGSSGSLGGWLLQGKPLSYNNILDLEAAWRVVSDFDAPTVAILKHNNPCGLASATLAQDAYPLALAGDPLSAFGSVIAVNVLVNEALVAQLGDLFVECIVAPGFTSEALDLLQERERIRVLEMPLQPVPAWPWEVRSVRGGALLQQRDAITEARDEWRVITRRRPSETEWGALEFAWKAVAHVKSNAIVFARMFTEGIALVGVGAGQMSRVDAVKLAVMKAGDHCREAVMGSDAFFPFPDGLREAAQAGITAVIQPGGSIRDEQVIAAADELGLAMVFTDKRHFRH